MPFTGKEESSARTALFLGGQEDVERERAGENAVRKKQVGREDCFLLRLRDHPEPDAECPPICLCGKCGDT